MKEIPILFSTPMIKAILQGRKTQTRRIVKFRNKNWRLSYEANEDGRTDLDAFGVLDKNGNLIEIEEGTPGSLKELELCRFGKVGDILWVRENWFPVAINQNRVLIGYYDKDPENSMEIEPFVTAPYWKKLNRGCMIPSIHMPKEAARIWLQVTDVRVERLQDITEEDAIAEGIEPVPSFNSGEGLYPGQFYKNYLAHGYTEVIARDSFVSLWQSINGAESWVENPWVWVISFKVLSTTGKPDLANYINIDSYENKEM